MKGYLLDTNILSDIIRNPAGTAASRIETLDPKSIFTSIVVASELRYGCTKKGSAALQAKVESLLRIIPVLSLDRPADVEYGAIRAELEVAGQPIGANDLLIAAHALAHGLVLVTNNEREFHRVRGLKVENWLVEQ